MCEYDQHPWLKLRKSEVFCMTQATMDHTTMHQICHLVRPANSQNQLNLHHLTTSPSLCFCPLPLSFSPRVCRPAHPCPLTLGTLFASLGCLSLFPKALNGWVRVDMLIVQYDFKIWLSCFVLPNLCDVDNACWAHCEVVPNNLRGRRAPSFLWLRRPRGAKSDYVPLRVIHHRPVLPQTC